MPLEGAITISRQALHNDCVVKQGTGMDSLCVASVYDLLLDVQDIL